ncbi:MAG: winged helix-turn-helix transcriptional regulator [Candidatus Aminicenantes bacterium]|nr:winged helix-turn-helix transcriptional regulator [Candidatus Aminicenantes bacterium]NIM82808.1 winged helix-turn-helix transcriptional regulator [Candidatus Aminicenantes bacterium]NIN22192.1 winged helix-turn-helix transcriptional regulator [Candidatus Aminicenantes bacterium]NIN45952.1 winged helix-turn-helix transcriptional regulator [Candidatus Aminicenantes bacterium]NIN88788.1 winged helix-turn-helix transcriptional regulator [Candidatus Aminicenantes bacterium]
MVAEIFKEAFLIERYESGIKRAVKELTDYQLPVPKISETAGGIEVEIFGTPQKTPQKISEKPDNKYSLSERILNILVEDSSLSQQEIAEKLGISFNTVKEYLNKLKKEGRIQRVGSRRNGHWKVKP